MNSLQKTARLVGILFIIGTVSGIISKFFSLSFLSDPQYLINVAKNSNQIAIAALFVLMMGFSLSMMSVVLFPVLEKHNKVLALGAVVFRGALEAVMYLAIVINWLLIITVSQGYAKSGVSDSAYFQSLGSILLSADGQISAMLSIVFSLGTLMYNCVFYQAKLIPRWLAVWGILGAVLYLAEPVIFMFGPQWEILELLLAVQEMVLAVWLIVKGFNPPMELLATR